MKSIIKHATAGQREGHRGEKAVNTNRSQQEQGHTARTRGGRSLTAGHCRWIKQRGSCPSLSPGRGSNSVHHPAGGKNSSSVASLHTRPKNIQCIASLIIPTTPEGLHLYLHCRAASARSFREYYTCSLALSMTQLSEPGWAEDTPPQLSPSLSFSVLLTSPMPRCNDTAEGFLSPLLPSTWLQLQQAGCRAAKPCWISSSLLSPAQPESAATAAEVISHFTIFTHLPGVYLLDRRAWQPQQCSVICKNNHSLPFGWNANAIKKRPRRSMRHCV